MVYKTMSFLAFSACPSTTEVIAWESYGLSQAKALLHASHLQQHRSPANVATTCFPHTLNAKTHLLHHGRTSEHPGFHGNGCPVGVGFSSYILHTATKIEIFKILLFCYWKKIYVYYFCLGSRRYKSITTILSKSYPRLARLEVGKVDAREKVSQPGPDNCSVVPFPQARRKVVIPVREFIDLGYGGLSLEKYKTS